MVGRPSDGHLSPGIEVPKIWRIPNDNDVYVCEGYGYSYRYGDGDGDGGGLYHVRERYKWYTEDIVESGVWV